VEKKLHLKLQWLQAQDPEADIEVWSGAGEAPPPVKMSIVWGYNQFYVVSGHQLESSLLLESKHNLNGFGLMVSSIQNQEKIIGGYYHTSILNCLIEF
jgi:hypothetical protein